LFACETKSPVIVKIALSALQKLIQFKAIPQVRGRGLRDVANDNGWGKYPYKEGIQINI